MKIYLKIKVIKPNLSVNMNKNNNKLQGRRYRNSKIPKNLRIGIPTKTNMYLIKLSIIRLLKILCMISLLRKETNIKIFTKLTEKSPNVVYLARELFESPGWLITQVSYLW
jgi:hypothetical protein